MGRDTARLAEPVAGGAGRRLANVPRRMALTTADQGFSSISNFAVGVAAARLVGARGLGGFSFGYVLWLLLGALHRSLVTDPMTIENDASRRDIRHRLRQGISAEIALGTMATVLCIAGGVVLLLVGQHEFAVGLLAFAPWLIPLVLQDYWRWIAFMHRRPDKALANDTVFNVVFGLAVAAVFVFHVHSIVAVTASWGAGGLAGALFGVWQFRTPLKLRGGLETLRKRLHFSKWIAGNQAVVWGAGQATLLVAGFILGPVGLGHVKAAQTLVYGPTLVLIQAGGSVGLPEASRGLANGGWLGLRRVARTVNGVAFVSVGVVGLIVLFFGRQLLQLVYGSSFGHYWLAADLFALAVLVNSAGIGAILILKASRRTAPLFGVSILGLLAAMTAVTILSRQYGVSGAAGSITFNSVCYVSGLLYFKRKARRDLEAGTEVSARTEGARADPAPAMGQNPLIAAAAAPAMVAEDMTMTQDPLAEDPVTGALQVPGGHRREPRDRRH